MRTYPRAILGALVLAVLTACSGDEAAIVERARFAERLRMQVVQAAAGAPVRSV